MTNEELDRIRKGFLETGDMSVSDCAALLLAVDRLLRQEKYAIQLLEKISCTTKDEESKRLSGDAAMELSLGRDSAKARQR